MGALIKSNNVEHYELRPLALAGILHRAKITHREVVEFALSQGVSISRPGVSQILNHGWRPANQPWPRIVEVIEALLVKNNIPPGEIAQCWEEDMTCVSLPHRRRYSKNDDPFFIEVEMLTSKAKAHFKFFTNPFVNDVSCEADLYISPDQRMVREAMYQAAKNGGWMVAVVGESGSGKTTLRRETMDRIIREQLPAVLIQPQTLDKNQLSASHIFQAILSDLNPALRPARSQESLARQVATELINSSRAGNTHLLIIEEAHDLSIQTLKQLKRFWEIEDGFKKLLSIVLLGQPELKDKLNERKYHEAREVIRRTEIVELLPLDKRVGEYLDFKFKRVGASLEKVMTPEAVETLRARLSMPYQGRHLSMAYPLVVNNLAVKAMNMAAEFGAPIVDADIVKGA